MEIINYRKFDRNAVVPSRGTPFSAGWDLSAAEDKVLKPMVPTLVSTALQIAIPANHMLLVLPRSGNSLKKNLIIPNSPGLVDEDFRGVVGVILTWIPDPSPKDVWEYQIKTGDRIAQAVLVRYETQQWEYVDQLPTTTRGTGGFGSTGG